MNSTCQILPGVRKIGWVDCNLLPKQITFSGVTRLPLALLAEVTYITFFGSPDCRCITEKENNGWMQTASLKFLSGDEIPFEKHIAFVVADVNDNWFVIGAYERPFPVIKFEKTSGAPGGSPAGINYEISHKAIRTMLPCIV